MRPLPRRETSVPDIIQTAKFKDTKTLTDNVDILAEDTVAAQHDDQLSMLPARREEKGQIKGQNISGGNWYKLGVNHFVLAFVFSIYFFIWWRLLMVPERVEAPEPFAAVVHMKLT